MTCVAVARGLAPAVSPGLCRHLERALLRCAPRLGLVPAEIRVRLVGARQIRALAATHMGDGHVTDVLSFPDGHGRGGDVALCWPQVIAQSPAAPRDEATRLLLHALAHLAGHDHGARGPARRMLRVERALLRRLRTPDAPRPYGA